MSDGTHLIDPELLAIMQCPACFGELTERTDPPALVCRSCGLAYAVEDGIPIMLVDEAERLSSDEAETPSSDEAERLSSDKTETLSSDEAEPDAG